MEVAGDGMATTHGNTGMEGYEILACSNGFNLKGKKHRDVLTGLHLRRSGMHESMIKLKNAEKSEIT